MGLSSLWALKSADISLDYLLLLALVQGASEFLPISSSGHLRLLGWLYDERIHALWLDIAVHGGTLLAGLFFFRRELLAMLRPHPSEQGSEPPLLHLLILASLPAILVGGFLFAAGLAPLLTAPAAIGLTSVIFACLLGGAVFYAQTRPQTRPLDGRGALGIGLAQSLAFLPGASRTGVALTAALVLGLPYHTALRFVLLLSLPAIGGAVFLAALSLSFSGSLADILTALFAAMLAFAAGLVALYGFVRFLPQQALWFFVVYRILLGAGLLLV